ncbi:MAG TPA: SUMF1/EgtB/PvdO family nonheme iron enzyme [Pyrinomonadaceae bacterium]|nr:SUMF1/EgtB/PvdO family nonheme iron enzyme [Pyrinomonadaceae bacterium]
MLSPNVILQNRYRVVRQLGEGGMGAVYEAVDQRVSCLVALKETFARRDGEARNAFEREAALLANLRHQALPKVMDYFSENEGDFLVMEFIPGYDLAELLDLRGGPFPQSQVLRWADDLLRVLEYLHGQEPPILHRDIKPSNLKLTKQGEVFLLDFGLAKGSLGQMPTLATSRSVRGYTPIYAALEQIHGHGTDARSDLYSLGATLYHLLTGVAPIDAPTRFHAVEEDQPDPLPPVEKLNTQASANVGAVIHQAMAVSRKQRPANAAVMRKALRNAAEEDERGAAEGEYRRAEARHREREEVRHRAEQEAVTRAEEERRLLEAETRRRDEESRQREEERRRLEQEEIERREREESKRRAEEDRARKDAETRRMADVEAKKRVEENRLRAEAEGQLAVAEEQRLKDEERQRREAEKQHQAGLREGEVQRKQAEAPAKTIPAKYIPQAIPQPGPDLSEPTLPVPPRTLSNQMRIAMGAAVLLVIVGIVVVSVWSSHGRPARMAYVPGGEFVMGRDDGDEYERPAHKVTVKPFYIDLYEVTREDYKKCVDEQKCPPPQGWTNGSYPEGTARQPATGVSWDAANVFAKWAGKRLPTEEEWEFAARGTDGRRYPWGNDWKQGLANANSASTFLVDVGTYKGESPYGAFDMAGNAWEWTATKMAPYAGGTLPARVKISDDTKVIRGGTYQSNSNQVTTTFRRGYPTPGENDYSIMGFRCVKNVQ